MHLLRPGTRLRQMSIRGRAMSGVVGDGPPAPPVGGYFAAEAHPAVCASDADHLVPCAAGDAIRWWRDLVTGTWYEQPTSGARPILRRDAGGWYAEGDGAGRFFDFPGLSFGFGLAGVSGTPGAGAAAWWEMGVGNNANTHSFLVANWPGGFAYSIGPPSRNFFAAPPVTGESRAILETTDAYLRLLTDGVETHRTTAAATAVTGTYLRLLSGLATGPPCTIRRFALMPPGSDVNDLDDWLAGLSA